MADDNQRSFGANYGRQAPRGASGNDPLAELARLIGQSDPFAEYGRPQQTQQPRPAPSWGAPGDGSAASAPAVAPQAYGAPGYERAPAAQHHDQFAQPGAQDYQGYDTNYYYDAN